MLDDLNTLKQRDPQDALGIAAGQWQYLQHDYQVDLQPAAIGNVVLAGMGGSALPGVLLSTWPGLSVPFEIVRNYELPTYVNEKTLVISSSYSGNTEEALAALDEAEQRGAEIVVIAAGGTLLEHAKQKNYPLFAIPAGIQPRMSSFYFLAALTQILEPLGIMKKGSSAEVANLAQWLKTASAAWVPTTPTAQNLAKRTAQELMGKSVIMYSGPKLFPAANKWKICLNENAKNLAWCNQYPEFNHNEFIGWSSHPVQKPFAVVEIRSNLEHERVQKRFAVTERLLSGMRPKPVVITPEGETLLQQLVWSMMLGDFVSIYLAVLNGVNPTPVELVEKLKTALNE